MNTRSGIPLREGELMKENPIVKLKSIGQTVWLDFISRSMLIDGGLARLIENEGLSGVTSNPTIFEKAIDGSSDYDGDIRFLASLGKTSQEIARQVMIEDIRCTADQFRTLYERTHGYEGYVSIEVSPYLAHDTGATIRQARRLWNAVLRPNIFVKVPATKEGIPAIRELICEGININVTLLFGIQRYREVAEAFIEGLNARIEKGLPVDDVVSVASFFLSRIDVLVDPMLEKRIGDGGEIGAEASSLIGKTAISSAASAYQIYKEIFESKQFEDLRSKGAHAQRVLWASTSTKNPDYSDTIYVDPLIGPDTVSTMPLETLKAYREHGNPSNRLEETFSVIKSNFEQLKKLQIDIDKVTQQLEDEGVKKFSVSFDKLIESLERKRITFAK